MEFEWDELKNTENQNKHGVSFENVCGIWDDPFLYVVSAKRVGEKRKIAIGETYSCIFSVVHTVRGKKVRLISARFSTDKERRKYYEQKSKFRK